MKMDKIKIKLPKTDEGIVNYFKNCEKRGKFIKDTSGHYKSHLKKAKHDLKRAIKEFNDECWDWTIIKAYYAIFHTGNALLSKKKKLFSKDHSCLIIALKYWNLIDEDFFSKLMDIYENFSDTISIDLTFQMRKISQYDVDLWEQLTETDASMILELANEFVSYTEGKISDQYD